MYSISHLSSPRRSLASMLLKCLLSLFAVCFISLNSSPGSLATSGPTLDGFVPDDWKVTRLEVIILRSVTTDNRFVHFDS